MLTGVANKGQFVLREEDHSIISESLPALIAAESKRKKQEEKEKQEKIAQLKAGDPIEKCLCFTKC